MNWLKAIKVLLGRFWADIFQNSDFLLGIEYLHFFYSKLTNGQYLNWRNGLIAADLSVEQDKLPFLIYIDSGTVKREWYSWSSLWTRSGLQFAKQTYDSDEDEDKMGWIAFSRFPIQTPVYMLDHIYGYKKMLIQGMDYDFVDGQFLFYTDPAGLDLPTVKVTDASGNLHVYWRLFGFMRRDTKVCDPVTGFESSWLNGCSDIAWDIHTNGATYYNTKQLLGKAVGAVICEESGVVESIWTEQNYSCMSVNGKVYYSKKQPNVAVGSAVEPGTVLYGKLDVFNGSATPDQADVPGIKVMTDAGGLTALNDTMATDIVSGMLVLPLRGDPLVVAKYHQICKTNMENQDCPYIQVGEWNPDYNEGQGRFEVNPYLFITKTLRRGRAVTIRLVAESLESLKAAIDCIRKSCCASGVVNVYVAAESDEDDADTLKLSEFSADAGMMAISVVETVTIKEECAEARILL